MMNAANAGGGTDAKSLVDQYAAKFGVPAWIVEDIVQQESGYNPGAVGDNGSSFGLLQLHRGGQAGNYPTSALENPQTNLSIGMPYIAAGYAAAKAQGYKGFSLLEHTAGESGHPGGSPGNYIMTQSYANGLSKIMNGGSGGKNPLDLSSGSASNGSNNKNPMTFSDGLGGFLAGIDNAMQIDFKWSSPVQSLLNDSGAIAFRTFLFLLGLIVLIFGLAIIVKKVS